MSAYLLTWVTKNLAVGHAPMSYEELESLKEQGIDAIVNLCGEFSDLAKIEEEAGFQVFWLPVPDETAPKLEEMEKGLEWLDEAIYLGKKVLVHCHHGIGRTGTFVTAYLLRRGFGLKKAGKILKATRANPTNFSQWWLLRKFGKKEGQLTLGDPTTENSNKADLSTFYSRYEQLVRKVDGLTGSPSSPCCTGDGLQFCDGSFNLELIEALYLYNMVNISLTAEQRKAVINLASKISTESVQPARVAETGIPSEFLESNGRCPLHQNAICLLHKFRPIHCRLKSFSSASDKIEEIYQELSLLSNEVFHALFGKDPDKSTPRVSFTESVSGKFIQRYFQYLTSRKNPSNDRK